MNNFQRTQQQFMAHIRDPINHEAPDGIEDRRMAIYRDLFFNNIEGFISSGFPVLKSLYSQEQWTELVRLFFKNHHCESPYFLHIAQEFLDFLSQSYQPTDNDPPYLLELAHYEWVELALSIEDEDVTEKQLQENNIAKEPLCLSHLAWNLSYQYPVQFISEDNSNPDIVEQGNYIVVYRDEQDEIQFIAINVMTALLLQIIEQEPGLLLEQVVSRVHHQVAHLSFEVILQGAQTIINDLGARKIIVTR